RALQSLGLIARGRIRYRQAIIDQETVQGAGAAVDSNAVPALVLTQHGVHAAVPQTDGGAARIRCEPGVAGGTVGLQRSAVQMRQLAHARTLRRLEKAASVPSMRRR